LPTRRRTRPKSANLTSRCKLWGNLPTGGLLPQRLRWNIVNPGDTALGLALVSKESPMRVNSRAVYLNLSAPGCASISRGTCVCRRPRNDRAAALDRPVSITSRLQLRRRLSKTQSRRQSKMPVFWWASFASCLNCACRNSKNAPTASVVGAACVAPTVGTHTRARPMPSRIPGMHKRSW
jgi:hypothetical protein